MKRRKGKDVTPLQQTKISNFFTKGDTKRLKTIENMGSPQIDSPDFIASTPPKLTTGRARKSLNTCFEPIDKTDSQKFSDSAYSSSSSSPPLSIENDTIPKKLPTMKSSPKKILGNSNVDNIIVDLDDFMFDEGWGSQNSPGIQNFELAFDRCVSCIVINSNTTSSGAFYEQFLDVKQSNTDILGRCVLRDMWATNIKVCPGDNVNILAKNVDGLWVVNSQHGYICLYPDIIVSSTSLVGAMFCRRRGVLSNLFRGLDSDSKIMFIGQLVHEILQHTLQNSLFTAEAIETSISGLFSMPSNMRMLYSCGVTQDEIENELRRFIPSIITFVKTYVLREIEPVGRNYRGVITEVEDIEKDVTSVNIGIRGRIDVTVRVNSKENKKQLLPLEVKTGRASFSAEHRNQVIMYTLMMSEVGERVESGLLLYIREGIIEEVTPSKVEIRDLILLRNEFAQYLRKFDPENLPEPIRLINACKKCPYLAVCSAYVGGEVSKNHPIRSIAPELEKSHLEYFQNWTKLVIMEDSYGQENRSLRLRGLTLEEGSVKLGNRLKYSFIRESEETSLTNGMLIWLISDQTRQACFGRIIAITNDRCSITVDNEIKDRLGTFTAEGCKTSLIMRYLTNLGRLLDEPFQALRKIIVDRESSNFAETFSKNLLNKQCFEILSGLNPEQRRAVLKVLTCQNYLLVEGPPGTGKTQTIVAMIQILLILRQSVLLVGHTHSSVDNVLIRIRNLNFLRLGSLSNIHESIRFNAYVNLIETAKTISDVEELLNRPIVASTCLGLDADIVAKRLFDVCIVDESSQVLQPEVLKPLFAAKKFVLIGDSKQLRPVVKNPEAKSLGMDVSIFEWLEKFSTTVTLQKQYRMNKTIMNLLNNVTYNGILVSGSPNIENQVLQIDAKRIPGKWLQICLSNKIENSVMFLDTSDYLTNHGDSHFSNANPVEANLVKKLVETLITCGTTAADVGVMSSFRAQIQILSNLLPIGVEVNTVDQYQGRDKEIVIFSCTKQDRNTGSRSDNELLNDPRRWTVALSRAKRKLIIVGDKKTLVNYKTFLGLFNNINENNILCLKACVNDFSWDLYHV